MSNVKETLAAFGKELRKQARANLTRKKKNVTSALYKSIDYTVEQHPNSFEFAFEMLPYGDYVDKGVSGTQKRYDTPFNYSNKRPPFAPLHKWVLARRLFMRNEKGQFAKGGQKRLTYLIINKIYTKGIAPTHFYSKPFERLYKRLPKDLIEAYQLDARDLLSFARNNKRLNG